MIKATEHFSFTVSSLKDSLRFFGGLLGLPATPVTEVDNPDVARIVGVPGAVLRISIVKLPDGQSIELIEYVKPKGKKLDLKVNNTGAAHIAFLVDDIQKMYDDLTGKGAKFASPPVWAPDNTGKGRWGVCYLKGPDGITIECIERRA
jgi:catechol 2,3-dioxygenase-like lactoylglutathione lyase family enzyme